MAACAVRSTAPVVHTLPNEFGVELPGKRFTNGRDDHARVAKLYREAFKQRFETIQTLVYSSLGRGSEGYL